MNGQIKTKPFPREECSLYKHGIIWVITGNGKGKTTSALGQAIRALGHGMSVAIIHFMKGSPEYGEYKFFNQLADKNLLYRQVGRHEFVNKEQPAQIDKDLAMKGWELAQECLQGQYSLVILDELNVALDFGLLDTGVVAQTICSKPKDVSVIVTGRYAPDAILEIGDTISEIAERQHHYASGIEAQKGMEY